MEIVKEYSSKYPHIQYISEKDTGIYNAMNKGINLSKGDWLYFLGADDELYSEKLLASIFANQSLQEYTLIYGDFFNGREQKIISYKNIKLNKLFFIEQTICHQAVFTHKSIFEKIGSFDERFKICADRKFMYDYFSGAIKAYYTNQPLAKYAGTGISMKPNYVEISSLINYMLSRLSNQEYVEAKIKLTSLFDIWLNNVLFYGESASTIYKALHSIRIDQVSGIKVVRTKILSKSFWLANSSDSGAFTNLHKGSILIGLLQVFSLCIKEKRFFYYLKNTIYWLKSRFFT
jgi:glycosyltransferase involved in cell wall biosynthesis